MTKIGAAVSKRLEHSPREAYALSLAALLVIGAADYLHDPDFNLSLLYVVPIAVAARYINGRAALRMALLTTLVWMVADILLGPRQPFISLGAIFWNAAVHLFGFIAAAVFISRLEDSVLHEHRAALLERRLATVKSEMLSLVSHQFANALSAMGLAVGLLENPADASGEGGRPELCRILKQNIQTLTLVAQNFLNQARLESGRYAITRQPVDLGAIIQDVLTTLRPLSQQKNISMSEDIPRRDLTVSADPVALNVILTNLIGNALKFTPAGGRVTISVDAGGLPAGSVRVAVTDSGPGIDKHDQRRVQRGFVRVESGKKLAGGFGLGLKLVHDLLQGHGSRLEIESEPGLGSRFSFVLS